MGGGFLVVPLLLLVYKLPPHVAAATSLVVVALNAASGSVSYFRAGRVDSRAGALLAAATVPGAFVGPSIATRTPEQAFKVIFATLLLVLAAFLLWRPERVTPSAAPLIAPRRWRVQRSFTDRQGVTFAYSYDVVLAVGLSFAVGILSSWLGIGGGVVHVPAMIHLMSFPVHIATATSQFVLAVTAAAGVAAYAAGGHVVWPLALAIGAGVIVGAQLGAALSHRLRGRGIVRLFTLAVVVLAGRLLWSATRG